MKRLSLFFVFLSLAVCVFAKTTVLYHTSDIHGFIYPNSNGVGGFATLANYLKLEKSPYLLLDSGDFGEGTLEAKLTNGLSSIQMMNSVGYNASTLGNHIWAFKVNGSRDTSVKQMVTSANFPILAANLVDKRGKPFEKIKPYHIFNVDGVKIAVIGLGYFAPENESSENIISKDLAKTLQEVVPQVEKENPNVIVLITHSGVDDDKHLNAPSNSEIVKGLEDKIQIVLGGHAHERNNININGVLYVESGTQLEGVSRIVIKTDDETGKFISAKAKYVELKASKFGEDPIIKKIAENYRYPNVDNVVAVAKSDLERKPQTKGELDDPLNNWIAQVFLDKTQADVAVHNVGAVRKKIEKGEVTRRDIYEMIPFENTLYLVKAKGSFLRELIETSLLPKTKFIYAGVEIAFTKDDDGNLTDLQIFVKGEPLDDNKEYTLVVNSYIAEGGSEGVLFNKIPKKDKKDLKGKIMREILEDTMFKEEKLRPSKTGFIFDAGVKNKSRYKTMKKLTEEQFK